MRIAYFDCFAGISGDMILGAIVDAGCPLETLNGALRKLPRFRISLTARKVLRAGIQGTKVDVTFEDSPQDSSLSYKSMVELLADSDLEAEVKATCHRILDRMAASEGAVHGNPPDEVRFHEIGSLDTMADVVGSVVGLRALKVDWVASSPVNVGSGKISGSHGLLPVPGPATSHLLKGTPIVSAGPPFELTTPTGAAVITSLSKSFGRLPAFQLLEIGYGAGDREFPEYPNLLRLMIGEKEEVAPEGNQEEIAVLETNIDDMNPEFFDHLFERAYKAGALEVFLTPVIMKKNRPGSLLSVLCLPEIAASLTRLLLQESSTFGVRTYRVHRRILDREVLEVHTAFGIVRVKLGKLEERVVQISPEYEDCKMLAQTSGVPIRTIYSDAQRAAESAIGTRGEKTWRT